MGDLIEDRIIEDHERRENEKKWKDRPPPLSGNFTTSRIQDNEEMHRSLVSEIEARTHLWKSLQCAIDLAIPAIDAAARIIVEEAKKDSS